MNLEWLVKSLIYYFEFIMASYSYWEITSILIQYYMASSYLYLIFP